MEYMVACNWEWDLIDKIDYPEVKTLFGGIPDSIISGGRSSSIIKNISYEDFKEYVKRVHAKGWSFDFNVNSTCMSNMEFTAQGHKNILNYIEGILELGVDSLTVSMPSLMEIIKKNFPGINIKVSTFQKVDSVAMAQRFEDLGADVIMLSEHANRDFKLLSAIRSSVNSKLALIANVGCIFGCPNMHSHANSISHSGAKGERITHFADFYQANCSLTRLLDPTEFVKSRWIRPEDVHVYEDLGIDMLKIIDRGNDSDTLGERVKAYSERTYDGNIIDMLGQMYNKKRSRNSSPISKNAPMERNEAFRKIGEFYKTFFQVNIPDLFYLDNKKIPKDFINGFMNRDCSTLSCKKCNYCKNIADTCMTQINQEEIDKMTKSMLDLKNNIFSGSALV